MDARTPRAASRPASGSGGVALAALIAIAAILPLQGVARPASGGAALERGKDDALDICAVCHVVAPDQRDAPLLQQPTPSFQTIADDPKWTYKSLSRFLATSHWNRNTTPMKMDRYDLPDHEMDDVVLYILSLRTHPTAVTPAQPSAGAAPGH